MIMYPILEFWNKGYRCTDFNSIRYDFDLCAKDAARICYLLAELEELKRIENELSARSM